MLAFNLYTHNGINVTCIVHIGGKFSFRSILFNSEPKHYKKLSDGKEEFNKQLDALIDG